MNHRSDFISDARKLNSIWVKLENTKIQNASSMAVVKMSIVWAIKHHALEQRISNKTLELLDIFMTRREFHGIWSSGGARYRSLKYQSKTLEMCFRRIIVSIFVWNDFLTLEKTVDVVRLQQCWRFSLHKPIILHFELKLLTQFDLHSTLSQYCSF